jgi:hypothetical protein
VAVKRFIEQTFERKKECPATSSSLFQVKSKSREVSPKGRLSTVDLLVLTSLDQPLLILLTF